MLAAAAGVALLSGLVYQRNRGIDWRRMMRRINWGRWASVSMIVGKRLLRR